MKQELQDQLFERYKDILELDEFGFELSGDGWFTLLDAALESLQQHGSFTKVVQVKEKLGRLRLYVEDETDEIVGIVTMAMAMARRTCGSCGSPQEKCSCTEGL